jgi:hypothetical protein
MAGDFGDGAHGVDGAFIGEGIHDAASRIAATMLT